MKTIKYYKKPRFALLQHLWTAADRARKDSELCQPRDPAIHAKYSHSFACPSCGTFTTTFPQVSRSPNAFSAAGTLSSPTYSLSV